MQLTKTLTLLQWIVDGKKQFAFFAVPQDMSKEDFMEIHKLNPNRMKLRAIGWVYCWENGTQTISYHMPTEWIPDENPIPEAFNGLRFKKEFFD